ncbi:MAG: LysM peptidoglycan-binding domain-containing protein [Candidatus Omnitrophica bacterium]|nr:LysM peptidoglycan-binding domain-containing protein [Candidatus Omnitrophota bacterium]
MNKFLAVLLISIFALSVGGCVTVKKVVRERVDQDVSGNRGYIAGEGDAAVNSGKPVDREYIDIRVEFPTWQEVTAPAVKYSGEQDVKINQNTAQDEYVSTPAQEEYAPRSARADTQLSGNRGYVSTRNTTAPAAYEYDEYEIDVYTEPAGTSYESKPSIEDYQEYIVKQGDTLSHIAKAFYGKAAKWTLIYEANADTIKDPAKVREGMKLKIPSLDSDKTNYTK